MMKARLPQARTTTNLVNMLHLFARATAACETVIAERRAVESALQRSRQQHQDIVNYASVGVLQTDLDGKILLANPALARILGYANPQELLGLSMVDDVYWDPTQRDATVAGFEAPDGEAVEIQWKRKDGSPIWVDLHGRAVRDGPVPAYFEGFAYDLTSRKRSSQFRQAQMTVGRLAGGVATTSTIFSRDRQLHRLCAERPNPWRRTPGRSHGSEEGDRSRDSADASDGRLRTHSGAAAGHHQHERSPDRAPSNAQATVRDDDRHQDTGGEGLVVGSGRSWSDGAGAAQPRDQFT